MFSPEGFGPSPEVLVQENESKEVKSYGERFQTLIMELVENNENRTVTYDEIYQSLPEGENGLDVDDIETTAAELVSQGRLKEVAPKTWEKSEE